MKIGIYDPYLDDLGGGEKYMMIIATCLAKNHEVTIFWDNKEDVVKLSKRFLFDFSLINITKNIFSPYVSLLNRLLTTRLYDVIIFLSDGSVPLSLSRKLFIHVQQPLKDITVNSLKTKIKFLKVNKLFCNSYFTKSFIDKTFQIKASVIYPPIQLYPKNVKKENIILHVGRFRVKNVKIGDYKKQDIMIEEFKSMVKKGLKNWRFILAASVNKEDQQQFKILQDKAKGFPIGFIINRNNKELWEIYNKAKIYWHASGFGEDIDKYPEYAEHFGISTVEAMGAGAVPVVINAGGQKEIVTDRVNGFLWDTSEELQEKTLKLIKNNKLWDSMSKEAKKRAEFFAGDRFCKEIARLIEN